MGQISVAFPEEIDVQNISTLGGSLDMRANYRLRKFLAGGSSLTEAHFADGGALEEVDYPASTSYVELKNLDKLTNEKCNTEACAPNVMSYFVSGCDNLQPIKMLIGIMDAQVGQVPHALRYVRCIGFNETFTDGRAFDKLSQLVDGTFQGIDAEGQYGNDPYPVLDGTINLTTGAYRDTYDALMTHYPKLKLNIAKWWIRFEDPEVKRICVENWDKDGDGELSMEEAAAVSSIGTKFTNNKDIRDFKEFKFFKNIIVLGQVIGSYVSFSNCTNLSSLELPESLVTLSYQAFFNTGLKEIAIPVNVKEILGESIIRNKRLTTIILLPKTPPTISNSSIHSLNENLKYIYVPDSSFEQYKQEYSNFWLANLIHPLSEYHS